MSGFIPRSAQAFTPGFFYPTVHPTPDEDPSLCDQYYNCGDRQAWHFGFKSVQQLTAWFDSRYHRHLRKAAIERMLTHPEDVNHYDLRVAVYEATHVHHGVRQSIFKRNHWCFPEKDYGAERVGAFDLVTLEPMQHAENSDFVRGGHLVDRAISYGIALAFAWLSWSSLNWLEVFAVATSFACTYLCVKQDRFNYPIGVVTTAAYSVLFWQAGLLASMVVNIWLIPTLIYGWFRWGKNENTKPVTHLAWNWWLLGYAAITAVTYAGALAIVTYFGGELAPTDSFILIGTVLAQYLLDNKKLETWFVWVVVNVVSIYTYSQAGLPLVALQYVFFLGNTVYGWYSWNSTIKETADEHARVQTWRYVDDSVPSITGPRVSDSRSITPGGEADGDHLREAA